MEVGLLLIGGVIGFFASIGTSLVNEYNKNKLKKKEFKREKLEEIFLLLNQIKRHILDTNTNPEVELNRLRMLVSFYFSNLDNERQKFYTTYLTITNHIMDKKKTHSDKLRDFEFQYLVFLNIIIKESKQHI